MAIIPNKKDSQEDDQVYNFSLLHMGLTAGMMIKDNLISILSNIMPNKI